MRLPSFLAALAVLLAGCGEPQKPTSPSPVLPPPPGLVVIYGRVLDFKTNSGVANATIKFYTPPLDATAGTVVTDDAGVYSVFLPPGTYNPRINGDTPQYNRGIIRPVGTTYLADYFINGDDNCVMFYGTIRSATTAAMIAGATITFLGRTQVTGSDGSYRLDLGCPTGFAPFGTGTRLMAISSPGYVTQSPYGNRAEFVPGSGLQRIDANLQPVP
jgi:hypothetical protein